MPSDAVPSYPAFASVESRVCFWCGTVLLCGCAVERLLAGGSRWILTMNRACRTVPLLVLSSSRVRGWDSVVESHCVTQVQQASPVLPCLMKEQCIGVMLDKANQCPHLVESGGVLCTRVSLVMSASNVHESQWMCCRLVRSSGERPRRRRTSSRAMSGEAATATSTDDAMGGEAAAPPSTEGSDAQVSDLGASFLSSRLLCAFSLR